jgi:hypothetical protein
LFTVRLLNVWLAAVPLIAWAAVELLKVTVPVPGAKVPPLFVQSPETLTFVPAVNVPAVRVAVPLMFSVAGGVKLPSVSVKPLNVTVVVLPETLNVPVDLLTTTLLKVWEAAVPLIACAPDPLNVIVLVLPANVPPLFVQSPVTL